MVLEIFDIEHCDEGFHLGFLIGQRFSSLIRNRVATDLILQDQLIPFSKSAHTQVTIDALYASNRKKYPKYWDELVGMAEGSGVSLTEIQLLNFRKEILPFISKADKVDQPATVSDDCSDVLVVNDSMAIVAHNEDANVALIDHVYLVKAKLSSGISFTAYTYAGELPSCAFAFNNHGFAFTLNSVPPVEEEIVAGGIGRNFVSRDLLSAASLEDALTKIKSANMSVGHSYNIVCLKNRKILNVEAASKNRISVYEVDAKPFFHANMYLHLQVKQADDQNSISRQRRAAHLSKMSQSEILSLLGDSNDKCYPIYMEGPLLYTLCTDVIDLDQKTLSIIQGNPSIDGIQLVLPITYIEDGSQNHLGLD